MSRRAPSELQGGCLDSNEITTAQAAKIYQALRPAVGYLYRLRERMEKHGLLPNDPYYRLVCQAFESMHRLSVMTHRLSCKGGVGNVERR